MMYTQIRIHIQPILIVSLALFILSYQTNPIHAHTPNKDATGLVDSPVIGIDFGHTHTYIGYYHNDTIHIIANISNIIAFTDTNILIGDDTKPYRITHPENTITNIKQLLGKQYDTPFIQSLQSLLPYHIISQQSYAAIEVMIKGEKKIYTPHDMMGMILQKLKHMVEMRLGYSIQYGVYTIPVQFGNDQRWATREAARIANLTLLRFLREPIAAAFAYGIDDDKKDKHVMVFDLGATKFDLTILDFDSHDALFEIITSQHMDIGGNTFNTRIINHYVNVIKENWNIDITKHMNVWKKLYDAIEDAKRSLSTQESVTISIPSLIDGHDFSETLTRIQFDTLCNDIYDTIITTMNTVLHDGVLEKTDIEDIVLVGGAARIPKIRDLLSSYFSNHTYHLHDTLPPDEIIAHGAAIEASFLSTVIDSDVEQHDDEEDDDSEHQHDEL